MNADTEKHNSDVSMENVKQNNSESINQLQSPETNIKQIENNNQKKSGAETEKKDEKCDTLDSTERGGSRSENGKVSDLINLNSSNPSSNVNNEEKTPTMSKKTSNSDHENFDKNISGKQNEVDNNSKAEKQEEDVPEDFFDDFLKEDFMAGLDIVDEDEEEQEDKHIDSKERFSKIKIERKIDDGKEKISGDIQKLNKAKISRKKPKDLAKKRAARAELKRLDAELDELRKKPVKIDKVKSGVDADSFDIRRDPEKTRQAIQRDKLKSAKDKEKRLITDIVETGLVPPGMELEVDLEEVQGIEKKLPLGDLREKLRSRRTRSKSSEKVKSIVRKRTPLRKRSLSSTKKKKSRSPIKRDISDKSDITSTDRHRNRSLRSSERSASRRSPLRRSPLRRSPIIRRSPIFRRSPLPRHSPPPRRSPLMHHRRSPILRRSPISTDFNADRRSPTFRRRSRNRSPISKRRSRSRSPILRRRSISRSPKLGYQRSRSRDRSSGYRRKRDRSYSPLNRDRGRRSRSPLKLRKEDKISFLEELAAKLNETRPQQPLLPTPAQVSYPMPIPLAQPILAPVPAPVPPPQHVFFQAAPRAAPVAQPPPRPPPPTSQQKYDLYDQSFFIGSPISEQPQLIKDPPINQRPLQSHSGPRIEPPYSPTKDVAKLFGDQRIKLSDFLAITAKPQVTNSSSAKLQEKIKVIQRCQEAIKILNEKRYTGPLVVHKTKSYQCSNDMTMSPLLRKPIIQLPFTTPGLKKSNELDFTKCCETLLHRIGIQKNLSEQMESEAPKIVKSASSKELPRTEIAPPVFSKKQNYMEPAAPIRAITKTSGTQTDKELSSCKECLRRKGILYSNCGVQAGNPTLTFSVSSQVTEADFYSMIPKTQSLASLTPAQLLGKQSMIARSVSTQDNMRGMSIQDNARVNLQVPSPPPPPMYYLPPQTSQRETAPYPSPMFSQTTTIPKLMQARPKFFDNKSMFPENRRGGYNSQRF